MKKLIYLTILISLLTFSGYVISGPYSSGPISGGGGVGGTGTPGGNPGDLQTNNAGVFGGIAPTANTILYSNGIVWQALTSSADALTFLGCADNANMRSALGVIIGTNVQAWSTTLDTLGALSATPGNNKFLATGPTGVIAWLANPSFDNSAPLAYDVSDPTKQASLNPVNQPTGTVGAVQAIKYKSWSFDPKAICDGAVDRLFLMSSYGTGNGIKIIKWAISFEADPTTEADIDLKRADAWIGVANAAVMDICDTTTGAASEATVANINSGAAVAEGKAIYLEFGTAYTETTHQIIFELWYYEVGP
jgi:hypothetical protein